MEGLCEEGGNHLSSISVPSLWFLETDSTQSSYQFVIWGFPGSLRTVSKDTAKRTITGCCRSNFRVIFALWNISVSSVLESVGEGMCMLREEQELPQLRKWAALTCTWLLSTGTTALPSALAELIQLEPGPGWLLWGRWCCTRAELASRASQEQENTFCSFLQNYCLIGKLDSLGTSCGIAGCGFALCNV